MFTVDNLTMDEYEKRVRDAIQIARELRLQARRLREELRRPHDPECRCNNCTRKNKQAAAFRIIQEKKK